MEFFQHSKRREHYSHVVSQQELDAFNAGSKAASAKAARVPPSNPQHRNSAVIQAEIDRTSEPLTRFTRELREKTAHREKVVESIGSVEGRIYAMKAAGVTSNHPNLQRLTGFTFSDKHDQKVFRDGILQQLQKELSSLDKKIKQFTDTTVPNQQSHCDAVLPALRAELDAAKKWEKLTVLHPKNLTNCGIGTCAAISGQPRRSDTNRS